MEISILKEQLIAFNKQQYSAFSNQDVSTLLIERSRFYDQLLIKLWVEFKFDMREDLTLIAVGGYGREEMFPLSDLDILILSGNPLDDKTQQQFNMLFNLLWDCKFQIGATIRTLSECISIGRNEISVATNMLESRFITGNKSQWLALKKALYQDDFWPIEDFFQAKIKEKNERYARYHNTSYNLEPDLKHSPGGLRDLHLLSWIMLRHYGIYSFLDLLNKGVLYPEEYQELIDAEAVLFRMRFGLHLQLKRYDNRLRFDRQLQLSEQLGYKGEGNQAVEAMMRDYFQATQSISQLSQLLLNGFKQTVLDDLQNSGEKQPLDRYFYQQDNVIFSEDRKVFRHQPLAILELFFHLTNNSRLSASATTLRQLRLALKRQTQSLSENSEMRKKFIELFDQPNVIHRAIVPMHQLGFLSAYLPQWKKIEGLMQFDLFHIYTVDEHTIRVMQNLENFAKNANQQKNFSLCTELFPQIEHKSLLYIAALFHDIGKGRDGDHAKVGAEDMYQFAVLHGFNEQQAEYMAWLVAEHLTMSITAQRRDIHDPEVVKNFANIVKNKTALSALTCLTVADICATNTTLWNNWKNSLFTQLFDFTVQQLKAEFDYKALSQENRQQALDLIKFVLSPEERIKLSEFWQPCPDSYFLRNTPTQLVWHALHYLKQNSLPMVLVSNEYARGGSEIFVHCEDQPQLFAKIAQILSRKKISIHDAQIITSENSLIFDSFIVTEANGQALTDERCKQIQQALYHILDGGRKTIKIVKKPVKYQSFKRKTRVRFLDDSNEHHTSFELFTLDREGLLAHVGYIFNKLGINLINAKITTIGERVEDFFVVSDVLGYALSKEEQNTLKKAIITELDTQ